MAIFLPARGHIGDLHLLETKPCNEWQMVAETVLPFHCQIITERAHASKIFIFTKQKRCIIDVTFCASGKRLAEEYMVYRLPFAAILVAPLCPIPAFRIFGK